MEKYQLGLKKKSFSLFFNGGEIWCEHLDSMCGKRDLVLKKFTEDLAIIARPSTSSFIAINLDETAVDSELLDYIVDALITTKRSLRKVVIVGLNAKMKRYVKKMDVNFELACIDDFEKAKEWLI